MKALKRTTLFFIGQKEETRIIVISENLLFHFQMFCRFAPLITVEFLDSLRSQDCFVINFDEATVQHFSYS